MLASGDIPWLAGRLGKDAVGSQAYGTLESPQLPWPPHVRATGHAVPGGEVPGRVANMSTTLLQGLLRTLVACVAGKSVTGVGVPARWPLHRGIRTALPDD